MTQTANTEQERAEFEAHFKHLDLTQEPDAWGVPRYKHDAISLAWQVWQAARRAPAIPQWPQFEQCQDAFDAAKNRYPQGNPLGGDHEWHWFQAGWNGRAPVVPQEGWKITEEMHMAAVKVLHRASGVDGLPQRMVDAMLAERVKRRSK